MIYHITIIPLYAITKVYLFRMLISGRLWIYNATEQQKEPFPSSCSLFILAKKAIRIQAKSPTPPTSKVRRRRHCRKVNKINILTGVDVQHVSYRARLTFNTTRQQYFVVSNSQFEICVGSPVRWYQWRSKGGGSVLCYGTEVVVSICVDNYCLNLLRAKSCRGPIFLAN